MKQRFGALRLTLLIVIAANLWFAYIFLFDAGRLVDLYGLRGIDDMHRYLAMFVGSFLTVFALGAVLALAKPLKYGSIIIMLLLSHFSIFLIDVAVLARGDMPWNLLLPRMIYFLVVSTALVRWYPVREKEEVKQQVKEPPPKPPEQAGKEPISQQEVTEDGADDEAL